MSRRVIMNISRSGGDCCRVENGCVNISRLVRRTSRGALTHLCDFKAHFPCAHYDLHLKGVALGIAHVVRLASTQSDAARLPFMLMACASTADEFAREWVRLVLHTLDVQSGMSWAAHPFRYKRKEPVRSDTCAQQTLKRHKNAFARCKGSCYMQLEASTCRKRSYDQ